MIDKINTWLEETKIDLIANYVRTGIIASGKYAEDLESQSKETNYGYNLKILGAYHSWHMEHGRRANKNQDKDSIKKFVGWAGSTFLAQWVKDKGLVMNPFAVAYKIATQGYQVPTQYHPANVISDVINDERIDKLTENVKNAFIDKVKSDVIKTLK